MSHPADEALYQRFPGLRDKTLGPPSDTARRFFRLGYDAAKAESWTGISKAENGAKYRLLLPNGREVTGYLIKGRHEPFVASDPEASDCIGCNPTHFQLLPKEAE